jgi:sugar phosphate permease
VPYEQALTHEYFSLASIMTALHIPYGFESALASLMEGGQVRKSVLQMLVLKLSALALISFVQELVLSLVLLPLVWVLSVVDKAISQSICGILVVMRRTA